MRGPMIEVTFLDTARVGPSGAERIIAERRRAAPLQRLAAAAGGARADRRPATTTWLRPDARSDHAKEH